MATLRAITIKVPRSVYAKIARLAKARKATLSAVVRAAIDKLDEPAETFMALAGDAVGSLEGPADRRPTPS